MQQVMQETMISIEDGGGPGMASFRSSREKRGMGVVSIEWGESPVY